MKTFANLPTVIETAITNILSRQETTEWLRQAIALHEQYTARVKPHNKIALKSSDDVLAYMAMRIPATYAQIMSVFFDIKTLMPSFKPKSLLDLGSGPGTGSWAATEIWPTISASTSIDQHMDFLRIGQQITNEIQMKQKLDWQQMNLRKGYKSSQKFDVVLIANVLNELSPAIADKLIGQALNVCSGVLIIIEPGTPFGFSITQNAAKKLSKAGTLLAPCVQNAFVPTDDYYLHFPQRFIRPEFQRRVRQHMREDSQIASDWEETKYAYTVISKLPEETKSWGRVVGPIEQQKGFIQIPILTKDKIEKVKVMKRNQKEYAFAKDLKWGELIMDSNDVIARAETTQQSL